MGRRRFWCGSFSPPVPRALPGLLIGAISAGLTLAPPSSSGAHEDLARRLSDARRDSERVVPGTPQARDLARELGEIGRGYLDGGDTARAVELLEEAYAWDGENGLLLAELTLAYLRADNFAFARFYLELAEAQAPAAPPETYAVLGDVYHSLHRLEDAVLAWEQAQRLGGEDPALLARLSRARQELSLTAGQKFLGTEVFSFHYDAAIPHETIERISESLSRSYRRQSEFFQAGLPSGQTVVLYGGRSYFSLVSIPEWVSGVYDGKIRVCLDPDGGLTPQLEGVLSHELTHALVRRASGDRAPGWLHEGLAQWFEGKRLIRAEIKDLFRGRAPLPLSQMEGNLARKARRAEARANYGEALGLVEYLVHQRGEGTLPCLVRAFREGLSATDALRREASLSPQQLVAGWKAWAGI